MSTSSQKPTSLDPSQLGTKEYWDKTYSKELEINASDPTDTGTVWFSDSLAQEKIVDYLTSQPLPVGLTHLSVLDLGTGNGEMLFALRDAGFEGKMMGVDYSAQSVGLAKRIAEEKHLEDRVGFKIWDILSSYGQDGKEEDLGEWDVVLDKGTFDAVSLSGVVDVEQLYVRRVEDLLKKEGLVVVTTCNWTEEELKNWFLMGGKLKYYGRIHYPTFKFGGVTGQSISSVCFQKNG